MGTQQIASKWKKTKVLLRNTSLRNNVPSTKWMTKRSLATMLQKYKMVYIKPDVGTAGIGVMKLVQTRQNNKTIYKYHSGTSTKRFASYDKFFKAIKHRTGRRSYLVQKGIHMLKYHGLPLDMRVMVQKNQGKWKVTGKVIRVAQRGKIVTNQHRGGKVYPLNTVLSCYFSKKKREMYAAGLNKLGLGVARQLQKTYTGLKELGIDVAPDQSKKPWILEVNTRPGIIVFRKLKDKRMYRKMVSYGKVYGRRY